jgi:flagellar protein FlgJ
MNFSSMSSSIADQSLLMKGADRGSADLTRLQGQLDMKAGQSKEVMREGLRAASKEFEAIFVYQMISAMRKTIGENTMMPKSNGEEIFEGMLDEEWSKKLAGTNGPGGLSEILYRQLSRQMGLEEEAPVSGADGASMLQSLQSGGLQIAPGTVLKDAR